MRKERVVLEHHADIAPVRGYAADVRVVDQDLPGFGLDEPGDRAQQRGLAAAARPEKAEEFSIGEIERHLVESHQLPTLRYLAHATQPLAHLTPPKR